jgi:hypothetical protein
LVFAAGVIFFVEDGKRGKLGSCEAGNLGSWGAVFRCGIIEFGKRGKLGSLEVGELFFATGVIFFMKAGKRGKTGRFTDI